MRTVSHLPVSVVPGTGRLDPDKSRKTVQHDRAEIRCGEICGLRVGSLFSGIEGFGLGFEQAGCEIVWQVEKEKFCRQVLARHWPKVKRFSDVRRVGAGNLQLVDCITAGVPCQDVSIAGKREGLAGKRTGLFYHFARILQELRPAWFVFENVPGLFSSNEGRDFAEVLRVLMVECGYGVSWRVFDSRYFNVAQRRQRVFIVGRLGKPCPAEILFESSSGSGNTATRGEARSDIAVPLTSGSGNSSHAPGRRMEDDWNIVSHALTDSGNGRYDPNGENFVVGSLQAHSREHGHAMSTQQAAESGHIITIQDVRGQRDKKQNGIGIDGSGGPMYTLDKTSQHAVAYTISDNMRNRSQGPANYVNALSPVHGGPDDNDAQGNHLVSAEIDAHGMRTFTSLPRGLDSARYRALGNAVTVTVAHWLAKRIVNYEQKLLKVRESENGREMPTLR